MLRDPLLRILRQPNSPRREDLEQSFNIRFLNLDIEASCEEDPDIMEIQPVRETDPWLCRVAVARGLIETVSSVQSMTLPSLDITVLIFTVFYASYTNSYTALRQFSLQAFTIRIHQVLGLPCF